MVTFMDISIFTYIGPVFMFLFVFAVVYGLLVVSKMFKDVPGASAIYGIISLVAGLFVIVSKDTFLLIGTMTPWFTVLIIFLFLIFFVVKMFSGPDSDLFEKMLTGGPVKWVLIILFVLILIISLSSTFGQHMLEEGTGVGDSETLPSSSSSSMTAGTPSQPAGQVVVVDANGNVVTNPQQTTQTNPQGVDSNDFSSNVLSTFTNPKILGLMLMLIIGFFAMLLLTQSND